MSKVLPPRVTENFHCTSINHDRFSILLALVLKFLNVCHSASPT